jgi:hypothetical protein
MPDEPKTITLSDGTVLTISPRAEYWHLEKTFRTPAPDDEFSDAYRSPSGLRWLAAIMVGSGCGLALLGLLLMYMQSPK